MNRIRLLSEQVANQIAAGEVVERPASVVKELVENSLDAAATRITVEIQAGGRSLIRVMDDGAGMNRDDALLCLERHATSKIKKAEDLDSIATMGFRGEALPSIASVSRLTLTTREHSNDTPSATQVIIHGGRIIEVKEAGAPPGTTVEVRQLFFNLPARRKFLRTEETERSHIQHYLALASLAFPQVALTFLHDSKLIWQLPPANPGTSPESRLEALEERLRALYPSGLKLLPVDFSDFLPTRFEEDAGAELFRVWGFIGEPGVSRSTRDEQHLFVNRRPIENRGLNFALLEGYHTALMKGRYPVCCLFLELNPSCVDVNIHPSKREVKFHQENAVRKFLATAIRQALLGFHSKPAASSNLSQQAPPIAPLETQCSEPFEQPSQKPLNLNWRPPVDTQPSPLEQRPSNQPPLPPAPLSTTTLQPPLVTSSPASAAQTAPQRAPDHFSATIPAPAHPPQPVPLLNVPLRLLGVIAKLYVVLESDRGLVLLDQHAAHERVLFEQMLNRLEQGETPSQRLLLPQTIELSPRDAQFLRENLPALARLGVSLSEFGERTFLLDAIPSFLKTSDARRFMVEVLDELKTSGEGINPWRLGEQIVAKTVCRHAVKANDPLSPPELEKLIEQLRHCDMPYTCPHGRPTLIEMNFRELEKKFGRVQ
jgi:DNA mismatch repair protein MutL